MKTIEYLNPLTLETIECVPLAEIRERFKKAAEKAYDVLGLTELKDQIHEEMGK